MIKKTTIFLLFFNCLALSCQKTDSFENPEIEEVFKFNSRLNTFSISKKDDSAYFSDLEKKFYSFSLKDSSLRWTVTLNDNFYRLPVFTDLGILLIQDDGIVFLLDYRGNVVNEVALGGRVKKKAVIYNNKAVVSVRGIGIVSLDLETFETNVLIENTENLTSSQPIISGNKLLVGDIEDQLICYDLEQRKELWNLKVSEGNSLQSEPMVSGDFVYFAFQQLENNQTFINKVDIKTGEVLYSIGSTLDINYRPVLLNSGIVMISPTGALKSFSLEGLKTMWSYELETNPMTQMVSFKGGIYIGLRNWKMIVFDGSTVIKEAEFEKGFGDPFVNENRVYFSSGDALYYWK